MRDEFDAESLADSTDGERATYDELVCRISEADSLGDLAALLNVASDHDAYFEAKAIWKAASDECLRPGVRSERFPGDVLSLPDLDVAVHGLTHADTAPERAFVRENVTPVLEDGAAVYCEQGIRDMYLADVPGVYEMDDYRWAMAACERLDPGDHAELHTSELERVVGDISAVAPRLRDATFSLIESGKDLYGPEFASALGDVASSFLTSHEDAATGRNFEAFRRSREAAQDPTQLPALQRYFWHAFLPQPIEREWLRGHDPELELLTHARNERMADYVVHEADASTVHVLVGAAHQPGVIYYLRQYRDGEKTRGNFEYVE